MARKYQVISADGHLEVPADAWTSRVPQKHRDKAPRLVKHPEDNTERWHMLDHVLELRGQLVCDMDYDQFLPHTGRTYHNPDGTPRAGTGNASQRLREQDTDGLDAEILYPPVLGGGFLSRLIPVDKEAYLSVIRAYNDWLAEDYCAVAPDRLIGNAMVPMTGVDDAVREMERVRKKGIIAASLTAWPNGGAQYKPEDDRFFGACQDLEVRQSPHGAFGGQMVTTPTGAAQTVLGEGRASHVLGSGMLYGLFDRFPKLQIYFAETNAGWIPNYLDEIDQNYERLHSYYNVNLKMRPSEYVRKHARFSFIVDRTAMKYRHDIGLDLLMWGSDFPHSVGSNPHSREILDDLFAGVPAQERWQVLVGNVCTFFGLDPNKDLTPTPA